jgi:glutamate-1-semialdehyde 2,1-aminomutase
MLAEGVAMAPGAYEAIFVGLGHDDAVLRDLADRASRAAVAAAKALI